MLLQKKQFVYGCLLCLAIGTLQAKTFDSLLSKHKQTKTVFSILAVEADSGRIVYQHRPEASMIPASNMKLVTTAAAVHYLGADYTFETKIGLLDGDLVVIGGGDPLLADPEHDDVPCQAVDAMMNTIVGVLQKSGLTSINNVIVDTSFFDDIRVHPSWPLDDLNKSYACEVTGLNFYTNFVHFDIRRSGQSALIEMTPPNDYITFINQLQFISSGDSGVGAYRSQTPNKLYIRGKLNQAAGFDVAIENPAGLFASVLKDRLVSSAIPVKGQVLQKSVKHNDQIQYLIIFKTPIQYVLSRANKDSLNLAAECFVKTISAENTPGQVNGRWSHAHELISDYLTSLGISADQYTLDDGSGLSRENRLSAACLTAVLKDMYTGKNSDVYTSSLAVGGEDGTIAKYFHDAPYQGNIIGKTGYISGVRSFSGVCKSPRGDIIFSILTESGNGNTRSCINDIARAIFDGTL